MKLFGTDGIRGKANSFPITAGDALEIGKAFVASIGRGRVKVAVGRDTRGSGGMLEEAFIAGVTAAGADALPLGVVPSNAVSFLLRQHGCNGAVMISASHNPAGENGMKFFNSEGFKIDEGQEAEVERIFLAGGAKDAASPGSVFRVRSVKEDYVFMISDSLRGSDLSGLKIAVDAGNGAASYIAKDLFSELKADAVIINNEPDGGNINVGGAMSPEHLQKLVVENKLDAGVAFDGDADRLVMVDESGSVIDGDSIIGTAAIGLKMSNRLNKNAVVVTDYSNYGLDASLEEHGISVIRVRTGDKFVSEELFRQGYSLGGENSGHIIFSEFSRTADAPLAAAQVLNAVKEQGRKLSGLASVVRKYPQVLVNVPVREKRGLEKLPAVSARVRDAEKSLAGSGRVFTRYSGTESKLRILVEGQDEKKIRQLAHSIATAVKEEIGV